MLAAQRYLESSNNMFVLAIYEKTPFELPTPFADKSVIVKWLAAENGIPLTKAGRIALDTISKDHFRCPILIDAQSARFHSDLLVNNDVIVILPHEMNRDGQISSINPYTEELAIAHTVRFWYQDKEYFENANKRLMSVVDLNESFATDEYLIDLIDKYYEECATYPSLLVNRKMTNSCQGLYRKLVDAIFMKRSYIFQNTNETFKPIPFPLHCQMLDKTLVSLTDNGNELKRKIKQIRL